MRPFKAFGEWYTYRIMPFSVAIRPFLRKASYLTTLLLCIISVLWLTAYLLPFNAYIVLALFYTLIALLIFSALLFLLYMITMQFDLDVLLSKHWLRVVPGFVFITLFVETCVVELIYSRHSSEWEEFFAIALPSFIGWLFCVGLSAIYAQLLTVHRSSQSDRYSN